MVSFHVFFFRFAKPLAERVTARIDFLVKTIPSGQAIKDKMLSYMEHRKIEIKQIAATKNVEKVTPQYMKSSMAPDESFVERGNRVKRNIFKTTTPKIPQVDNQSRSVWKQQPRYGVGGNLKVSTNNALQNQNNLQPQYSSNQDVNKNQINSDSQALHFGQGDNLAKRPNLNIDNNVQRMGQNQGQHVGLHNNQVPILRKDNKVQSNSQNIIQTDKVPKTVPIISQNFAANEFHREQEAIMDKLPEMIKMPELAQKSQNVVPELAQKSQNATNIVNIPNDNSEKDGILKEDSKEGKQPKAFVEDVAKEENEADNEVPQTPPQSEVKVELQAVVESNNDNEEAPLGKSNLSEVDRQEEVDEPSKK